MAIVTFISDFGVNDFYTAAVKAKIYSISQNLKIVDITHSLSKHNIPQAAFILKSVYKDFPKGTVHLVCVGRCSADDKILALKLDEHYFVGADNGLFSLINDRPYTAIVELKKDIANHNYIYSFPEKTTFANAAAALANGMNIYNLGPQVSEIKTFLNRQPRPGKTMIEGYVIHVDSYGNIITNITREMFEQNLENRRFEIFLRKEKIEKISRDYYDSELNELLALFNSQDLLEIAICEGSASELFAIDIGHSIFIKFL